MPDTLTPKKTVAILGAGPVGLAAAAHVLERGMEPIVLEAGPQAATPCASGATSECSHRGNTISTRRPNGCCGPRAGIRPGGLRVSDRRGTGRALPRAAGDAHGARGHIRTSSRVTAVGRAGFDKMKSKGRDA